MEELNVKGSIIIGSTMSGFAKLIIKKDCLIVDSLMTGKICFRPEDIIDFRIGVYSIIGHEGIRIFHRLKRYKDCVLFTSFSNLSVIMEQIESTNFYKSIPKILTEADYKIIETQRNRSFPYNVITFYKRIKKYFL